MITDIFLGLFLFFIGLPLSIALVIVSIEFVCKYFPFVLIFGCFAGYAFLEMTQ